MIDRDTANKKGPVKKMKVLPERFEDPAPRPEFMKLSTAATFVDTSIDTLRDHIRQGELTGYRRGRHANAHAHVYVRTAELLELFYAVPTVGNVVELAAGRAGRRTSA